MKIGAQLFTVRDYTQTPGDIEKTLRRIKAMDFDVIQISRFGPCDNTLLSGWIKELGFDVCCTHTDWNRLKDEKELDIVIKEHRQFNCDQIGLGMKPSDLYENSYDGYTRFIAAINRICRQVREAGLTFAYHNHEFEFEKWYGKTAMDRIIEECPDLQFILDTFWVQAGGCNPVNYIRRLEGRMKVCHFKDYKITDRARKFAEIGQGNLDWDAIIGACGEIKVPYVVIEQDADFNDPFESLGISLNFLKSKIGGAGSDK